MDSLKEVIEKWINWRGNGDSEISHYSAQEFRDLLEEMYKKEEGLKKIGINYGVGNEVRIHAYAMELINHLIGKMDYGKRV